MSEPPYDRTIQLEKLYHDLPDLPDKISDRLISLKPLLKYVHCTSKKCPLSLHPLPLLLRLTSLQYLRWYLQLLQKSRSSYPQPLLNLSIPWVTGYSRLRIWRPFVTSGKMGGEWAHWKGHWSFTISFCQASRSALMRLNVLRVYTPFYPQSAWAHLSISNYRKQPCPKFSLLSRPYIVLGKPLTNFNHPLRLSWKTLIINLH